MDAHFVLCFFFEDGMGKGGREVFAAAGPWGWPWPGELLSPVLALVATAAGEAV